MTIGNSLEEMQCQIKYLTPFNFIPQGGGDYYKGNRCPGEFITIEILRYSMEYLVNKLNYKVPPQAFSFRLNKMPTLPKSGFIMSDIKRKRVA